MDGIGVGTSKKNQPAMRCRQPQHPSTSNFAWVVHRRTGSSTRIPTSKLDSSTRQHSQPRTLRRNRNTSRKPDCRRSGRVGRFNTSSRRCSSPLHKNHVYSAVTETRNWSRQFLCLPAAECGWGRHCVGSPAAVGSVFCACARESVSVVGG